MALFFLFEIALYIICWLWLGKFPVFFLANWFLLYMNLTAVYAKLLQTSPSALLLATTLFEVSLPWSSYITGVSGRRLPAWFLHPGTRASVLSYAIYWVHWSLWRSTEYPQGHLLAMVSSRIRKQTRLGKLTWPELLLYLSVMRLKSSLLMKTPERKSGMGR